MIAISTPPLNVCMSPALANSPAMFQANPRVIPHQARTGVTFKAKDFK
jgi:hypothetical protein